MIGIGSTVGNYVIRRVLGEGGMGIVYLAEHPEIGRRAAVKVMRPEVASDADAVSRFFIEAQAVTRIGHHHIVEITDFGRTPEGQCYLVMEFLVGASLRERLQQGRLSVPDAVHVGEQIADALGAAHGNGILHRDLKPDNVFLIARGEDPIFVKVLDFGLAKLVGDGETVSHRTQSGTMMGTPYYMSPEQCMGHADIDVRTDVYALGVMLFEMLTGGVPYTGRAFGEIVFKHMSEPVPHVQAVRPECPPWLDALMFQMMAKDKAARPPTMAQVRAELRSGFRGAVSAQGAGSNSGSGSGSNSGSNSGSEKAVAAAISFDPTLPPNTPQIVPPTAPISTLGYAAGEGVKTPPPVDDSRRGLKIGGSVAAVALTGVIAFVVIRDPAPATPPAYQAQPRPPAAAGIDPAKHSAPTPAPNPAPEPEPEPAAASAARFHVEVDDPAQQGAADVAEAQLAALASGDIDALLTTLSPRVFKIGTDVDDVFTTRDRAFDEMRRSFAKRLEAGTTHEVELHFAKVGAAPAGDAAWLVMEFDLISTASDGQKLLTSRFMASEILAKTKDGWKVVAMHWAFPIADKRVFAKAAKGQLPAPGEIVDHEGDGAAEAGNALRAALASKEAMAAALAPGNGGLRVFGLGTAGERMVGRKALSGLGKLRGAMHATGGIHIDLAAPDVAWAATNIARAPAADEATMSFRLLTVAVKLDGEWRLVMTHFSIAEK